VDTSRVIPLLNVVALATIMLSMGLQVKFDDVLASFGRLRLLLVGLLANYVLVPAVTLGLLHAFRAELIVSVGFFVLAVCPGAPIGPPITAIARGDVVWAIGLMVILAGFSAFLSPALLQMWLARVAPGGDLHVDYSVIVRTLLITQMLPLMLGMAIRHVAPTLTGWITKPVSRVASFLLLLLVGLILAVQHRTLAAIHLRGWIGMSMLLFVTLGIGWFCGGREPAIRKSMAVTTTTRNAAVGLVIVTGNFADTPAVTAVIAYALLSTFGALGFALALSKFAANGQVKANVG
jgi:bile acid:Na+ symporter, BASS family